MADRTPKDPAGDPLEPDLEQTQQIRVDDGSTGASATDPAHAGAEHAGSATGLSDSEEPVDATGGMSTDDPDGSLTGEPGAAAAGPDDADKAASRRTRGPRTGWQLLLWTALGLVAALVLGWFAGILTGKAFGPEEQAPRSSAATSSDAKATGEGSQPGESIKIVGATLFDPPPGDGQENADRINLSYDGQPGTAWPTLQYKGNASFGNLKPGVGIVYDLGAAKTVSQVSITTTIPGATVEIRTGGSGSGTIDQFPVVAGPTELQASTQIAVPAGTQTQYLLVWITTLAPQQNYFQASLAEVSIIS